MSQSQIDTVIRSLKELGFVEGKHYSFDSSFEGETVLTVSFPETRDIPEELKPYQMDGDNFDRYWQKGSGEKYSPMGVNYETALNSYLWARMDEDPEYIEFCRAVDAEELKFESFEAYEDRLKAMLDRIALDPQIAGWQRDLAENYR